MAPGSQPCQLIRQAIRTRRTAAAHPAPPRASRSLCSWRNVLPLLNQALRRLAHVGRVGVRELPFGFAQFRYVTRVVREQPQACEEETAQQPQNDQAEKGFKRWPEIDESALLVVHASSPAASS